MLSARFLCHFCFFTECTGKSCRDGCIEMEVGNFVTAGPFICGMKSKTSPCMSVAH